MLDLLYAIQYPLKKHFAENVAYEINAEYSFNP